jgi:hypothetical protein
LIPVKSNLWFDVVQANVYDRDGVASNATFLAFNPSNANEYQDLYASMGEAAFTLEYRKQAFELIAKGPLEVLRRVARRAWSAFVFLPDPDDLRPVSLDAFEETDLEKVRLAGLIKPDGRGTWAWLCLSWPEEEVIEELTQIGLVGHESVPR